MKGKKCRGYLTLMLGGLSLLIFGVSICTAEVVIRSSSTDIGNIIFISPTSGTSAAANGTALLNTLADITGTAENPYLIKLGPGIFDLGTCSSSDTAPACVLEMKQFVSIEGAGEKMTKITSKANAVSWPPTVATVKGADNVELRSLAVDNTASSGNTVAILNVAVAPLILHVVASASGGTNNYGIVNRNTNGLLLQPALANVTVAVGGGEEGYGVYNSNSSPAMTNLAALTLGATSSYGIRNESSSSPAMTNVIATAIGVTDSLGVYNVNLSAPAMNTVTASASGLTNNYGVYNEGAHPVMTNVTASAANGSTKNIGVYNINTGTAGTVRINNSVISGTESINNQSGMTAYVGNTQLSGTPSNTGGIVACVGLYDNSYNRISSIGATTCQ